MDPENRRLLKVSIERCRQSRCTFHAPHGR
ncbi:MAG: hypothetical protein QM760_02120 [Nibricoccus sp.]